MGSVSAKLARALQRSGLRRSRPYLLRALLLGCGSTGASFLLQAPAVSHEVAALEIQVKAAMLYKFLSYIEWPEDTSSTPEAPYKVWVLGASGLADELREIGVERNINGRPMHVFQTKKLAEIDRPHAVFVGRHAEKHLPALSRMAAERSFLIVTESEAGLIDGSTINLRLVDGRMGFDVSLINAQQYNLKLSARLLSVATSIQQETVEP